MSKAPTTVVRLSTPGDLVAAVPSLCGFGPQESIVVLSLRGPRKRLGLTVRLDLPGDDAATGVAQMFVERVVSDRGSHAAIVTYSERRRREHLVDIVLAELRARRVEVTEALHVQGGRWTSYLCAGQCCPPQGTPLPPASQHALLAAENALLGNALLDSREQLVRSLAPPQLLMAAAARQHLDEAWTGWVQHRQDAGLVASRRVSLIATRRALDAVADGGELDQALAAQLAVWLHDVTVRDEVVSWALARSDELLLLLQQIVRLVVAPDDVPACTALAWVAYERGNGAVANVALDRALAGDPGYRLAALLRRALDAAIPPSELRSTMRAVRTAPKRRSRQAS